MIIDNAGTYTLRYTATDECGNSTTVDRELIVEEPWGRITWSDGTDEEIVAMVAAADRGEINLADYWNVGDERVVHLSAMGAMSPLTDAYAEQDVTLVLMNAGGKELATPTEGGRTECSFIVGQKESLGSGYMYTTGRNNVGWDLCPRRTWCNTTYLNSYPSSIRSILKQVKNKSANGSGPYLNSSVESIDYFALAAEYEVLGEYIKSSSVYENGLTQFDYYKDTTNRIKRYNEAPISWFLRSSVASASDSYSFCTISTLGNSYAKDGSTMDGISPFGCI